MNEDIEKVIAESGITDPESLQILRAKLVERYEQPGDTKAVLVEFAQEIAEKQTKHLQEQGWTAPPQIDEGRLVELNARNAELRKARPTQANMAERANVRKEIAGIVDASGVTYKVNRQ